MNSVGKLAFTRQRSGLCTLLLAVGCKLDHSFKSSHREGRKLNLWLPLQHLCMDLIGHGLPVCTAKYRCLRTGLQGQCCALILAEVLWDAQRASAMCFGRCQANASNVVIVRILRTLYMRYTHSLFCVLHGDLGEQTGIA